MKYLSRTLYLASLAVILSAPLPANAQDTMGQLQTRVAELEAAVLTLQATVAALTGTNGTIEQLQDDLAALEANPALALGDYVSVDANNTVNDLAPPHIFIDGANVHVRNGEGETDIRNGLGNLLVGYNEVQPVPEGEDPVRRDGSHNLVVGPEHGYRDNGGFVAGVRNIINGQGASVTGGSNNRALTAATVTGGMNNRALGLHTVISGGQGNIAGGRWASLIGGFGNQTNGDHASVLGGSINEAWGSKSTVTGGAFCMENRDSGASTGGIGPTSGCIPNN